MSTTNTENELLKKALLRAKSARKQAEKILEDKSRELYRITQELQVANEKLKTGLTETTSELKGVFENLVDAYVLMDLSGKVIKMNDAARDLFGYDSNKEEINVVKLIHESDFKYAMTSFQKLITAGSFSDYQARVYTKNKGIRNVHINASLILDKNKTPIAAQGIVRDITYYLEQERNKEFLVKTLEKNNLELKNFAHIVSHDLKSPLRSMNALINWLKEDYAEAYDEAAEQTFDMLLKKVDKMDHLITGILKYSSIDKVNYPTQNIDLNEVVSDVIDIIFIPDHVSVTIETKLPIIKGDTFRLQQLFQNLLTNAVNYIDKEIGKVSVSSNEHLKFWEFAIRDNGKGISEKYQKKIFEIFQSLEDNERSTGIGLSIVKKIIEFYGGTIWIESEVGKGATFYFTIKKNLK